MNVKGHIARFYPRKQLIFSLSKGLNNVPPFIMGFAIGTHDASLFIIVAVFQTMIQLSVDRLFFWAMEDQIKNGNS